MKRCGIARSAAAPERLWGRSAAAAAAESAQSGAHLSPSIIDDDMEIVAFLLGASGLRRRSAAKAAAASGAASAARSQARVRAQKRARSRCYPLLL